MTIDITNDLSKEEWKFYFNDMTLYLDWYTYSERETKRHKFKVIKSYHRLGHQRVVPSWARIEEEDVIIPEVIVGRVLNHVRDQITVKKWSER